MASESLVSIGCDHAGFELKGEIIKHIASVSFLDRGCFAAEAVDYPDIAYRIRDDIEDRLVMYGVLVCGTGIGMSIAANRSAMIRAALCYDAEMARLAREHNDANVLCLGARKVSTDEAIGICREFFATKFSGERHQNRVMKLGGC